MEFTRKNAKMKRNRSLRYVKLDFKKFCENLYFQHSKMCSKVKVGKIVKDKCEDTYLNVDGKACEEGFKQEGKHCVRTTVLEE